MATRAPGNWGAIPDSKGHQRLVAWVDKHSIKQLADVVGVKSASAHAWYWRDSRPSDQMLDRIVETIGGSKGEWLTEHERAELRTERRERQKRLREIQKGAA